MTTDPVNNPTPAQLVERWENVERVLVNLPEHEATKHFDMSKFVAETPCGTVCCAAGHCAFDPWFNAQGWRAAPYEHDPSFWIVPSNIDIHRFFGREGSRQIFHDYTPRPIEVVVDEVRAHIEKLRQRAIGYGFAAFRAATLTALKDL